ncbi:uncharacterized protein L969DRAFT_52505 [Mixia osmundae IAM 14324]|uniref:Uncharacterized protein n=1 Tax=Mixia osmundae (strain CBS 9802 / IAM 14324 / JCM 22182 / KY 12970) TaxID=764103 RepID=G7E4Z6_MIXOS|nr:uncharacterized protein L969DRAFT_52505 [Mixia osmundae IAM 14324]KEI37767.1 hypothetical protein L969DRAFT_52505 [Mixia osmundae IAM 14324]GAA97906.1 hypothetical protein E5Q_04586 [Mixia osmundae IAM 14324]
MPASKRLRLSNDTAERAGASKVTAWSSQNVIVAACQATRSSPEHLLLTALPVARACKPVRRRIDLPRRDHGDCGRCSVDELSFAPDGSHLLVLTSHTSSESVFRCNLTILCESERGCADDWALHSDIEIAPRADGMPVLGVLAHEWLDGTRKVYLEHDGDKPLIGRAKPRGPQTVQGLTLMLLLDTDELLYVQLGPPASAQVAAAMKPRALPSVTLTRVDLSTASEQMLGASPQTVSHGSKRLTAGAFGPTLYESVLIARLTDELRVSELTIDGKSRLTISPMPARALAVCRDPSGSRLCWANDDLGTPIMIATQHLGGRERLRSFTFHKETEDLVTTFDSLEGGPATLIQPVARWRIAKITAIRELDGDMSEIRPSTTGNHSCLEIVLSKANSCELLSLQSSTLIELSRTSLPTMSFAALSPSRLAVASREDTASRIQIHSLLNDSQAIAQATEALQLSIASLSDPSDVLHVLLVRGLPAAEVKLIMTALWSTREPAKADYCALIETHLALLRLCGDSDPADVAILASLLSNRHSLLLVVRARTDPALVWPVIGHAKFVCDDVLQALHQAKGDAAPPKAASFRLGHPLARKMVMQILQQLRSFRQELAMAVDTAPTSFEIGRAVLADQSRSGGADIFELLSNALQAIDEALGTDAILSADQARASLYTCDLPDETIAALRQSVEKLILPELSISAAKSNRRLDAVTRAILGSDDRGARRAQRSGQRSLAEARLSRRRAPCGGRWLHA